MKISKKVCLLGDFAVGKTSLVRRFVYDLFDDSYISTIGVKVSRKTIMVPGEVEPVELSLMLWDLAGSEEFTRVQASYMRGATGAVLVCDLTRPETLDSLARYVEQLRGVNPHARFVVAANKADLEAQRALTEAQVAEFATALDASYALTSAKTGTEVEALFRALGSVLHG